MKFFVKRNDILKLKSFMDKFSEKFKNELGTHAGFEKTEFITMAFNFFQRSYSC